MKIGIVGLGLVGSAVRYGLEKLGHEILVHDVKLSTSIEDVYPAEVVFICVPTPSLDSGECDTSIVEGIVSELNKLSFNGLVSIKSTVIPGTTTRLIKKFPDLRICFVPEFLRERCAEVDFVENHDVCIIGTQNNSSYNLIKEAHGSLPKKFIQVTETEAELSKYFNNVYNATLITFANNFYELCQKIGANYTNVKNAIVNRSHISDLYLDCNNNFRGFGGVCLPKDTNALRFLSKTLDTPGCLFETLIEDNKKYKTTVYDNMRKS